VKHPPDTNDLEQEVINIVARESLIAREKLTPEATLESLGLASLDVLHILLGIEDSFGVYLPVDGLMADTKNVGDLIKLLTKLLSEKRQADKQGCQEP
jgi:acyl carrier protein